MNKVCKFTPRPWQNLYHSMFLQFDQRLIFVLPRMFIHFLAKPILEEIIKQKLIVFLNENNMHKVQKSNCTRQFRQDKSEFYSFLGPSVPLTKHEQLFFTPNSFPSCMYLYQNTSKNKQYASCSRGYFFMQCNLKIFHVNAFKLYCDSWIYHNFL